MNNIENIKQILEKEYNENCTKINNLSEKIQIIKANNFETKLTIIYFFSIIPWIATMILLPTTANSGIIPINLISPLSIAIPALIGITGETLLTKKSKYKEKLKAFSQSKSQKEKIEESTKYEIEREKLRSSNRILKKAYDNLDTKQNLLNSLSNEYNIVEKEFDSKSAEKLLQNIENVSKILEQKKKNIDTLTTKSIIKAKFWRIRDRFQKVSDFIMISMLGGAGFMILYDLPVIAINNLGNNIQLQTSLLDILAPLGIGGLVCGSYTLKRTKDHIDAFRNINKVLGQEALSETTKDSELKRKTYNNDIERFDIELNNLIKDTYVIRLQLELEKQKLANVPQISNTKKITDTSIKKLKENNLTHNKASNEQTNCYRVSSETPIIKPGPILIKKRVPKSDKK